MSEAQILVGSQAVWFARNSDREPGEPQAVIRLPAVIGDPTPQVRTTYLEIPQQPARHAVILSKPVWSWGGEMGVNERGVAIGCMTAGSRRGAAGPALLAMDLVRLGLERAASAREAAEVIVGLLARHGQGGAIGFREKRFSGAARFALADAREALMLETLGHESKSDTVAASAETSSFPRQAALLRSHRRGHEDPGHGDNRDICLHAAGYFRSLQTTGSMVVRLGAAGPTAVFTGTSAPCLSIFRPAAFTGEFSVLTPASHEIEAMLWRRHEFLHRRALADRDLRQRLRATRDPIEAKIFAELAAEQPGEEALIHADRLAAAWHKVLWEALPLQPTAHATRYWSRLSRLDGIV